jgi:hypothetical protein
MANPKRASSVSKREDFFFIFKIVITATLLSTDDIYGTSRPDTPGPAFLLDTERRDAPRETQLEHFGSIAKRFFGAASLTH